jgi:hypothetical protein
MKSKLSFLLILLSSVLYAQSNPQIMFGLVVADSVFSRTYYMGIDPMATDGIDFDLGEANLPPPPPAPAFDVRLVLPEGGFSGVKSSEKDFRNGSQPFSGQVEHRLKKQNGRNGSLNIIYNLPQTVNIHLEDLFGGIVVNTDISGSGSFTIPDALDQLKIIVNYSNTTDVNDEQLHPVDFNLLQNYPNPFNPSTIIRYSIPDNQFVSLKVYDILGKEVTTLINEEVSAGTYNINFNGNGLTSGIYFYSIKAGAFTETKSMILMK